MLSILAAAFLVADAAAEPLTVIRDTGETIVLGQSLANAATYSVRFPSGPHEAPVPVRIDRAVFPEPFEILAADEAAATAVVRTTKWGAFKLGQAAQAVDPEVPSVPRDCSRAMIYLDLDPADAEKADTPELHGDGSLCPGAVDVHPQRSLILEGLDSAGKRLWVTAVPDPRWTHAEVLGADGDFDLLFAGQLPVPVLYAAIKAPITPELEQIAWYEIRKDGEVRRLGATEWAPAAPAAD